MKIHITIQGVTPLLMNRFREEQLTEKADKTLTPREQAKLTAYLDDKERLYLPTMNIYSSIIGAGRFHKQGKNKISTQRSSLIPAGVLMTEEIAYFMKPTDFEVDSRPVVIPATGGKIMKHRARLDEWKLKFMLDVDQKVFTEKELRRIIDDAGSKIGLGDFRPERRGFFGRFVVVEWKSEQ